MKRPSIARQWLMALGAGVAMLFAPMAAALPVPAMGTWATSLHARNLAGNPVALDNADAVFLYDDILDVTWLRDATGGGQQQSWYGANQWAADLVVGTFDDWRLPRVLFPTGLPGDTICIDCLVMQNGNTFGRNSPTKSGDPTRHVPGQTVYSEMAHLYYVTLGNRADRDANGNPQPQWGLINEGPFRDLLTDVLVDDPYFGGQVRVIFPYWSETPSIDFTAIDLHGSSSSSMVSRACWTAMPAAATPWPCATAMSSARATIFPSLPALRYSAWPSLRWPG